MITQCKRCGFKNYDPYLRLPSCGHCHQDPYTKAPEVPFVEREGHLEEVLRCQARLLMKMAKAARTDPLKMPEIARAPTSGREIVERDSTERRYPRQEALKRVEKWCELQDSLTAEQHPAWAKQVREWQNREIAKNQRAEQIRKAVALQPQRVYSGQRHPNYIDGDFSVSIKQSEFTDTFKFTVKCAPFTLVESVPAGTVVNASYREQGMEKLCNDLINKLRVQMGGEEQ